MTAEPFVRPEVDPCQLAAEARSILACPRSVSLVVDGHVGVLDSDEDGLGMQDFGGAPTFACRPDSELALAAGHQRSALLTVESGLGVPGSPEHRETLTLAGRLETRGAEECDCCLETRTVVVLDLNFVLLTRQPSGPGALPDQQFRVPLESFRSPAHHLNRGYLQRSVEHANHHHQDELRQAISMTTRTPMGELLGVSLSSLTARSVDVSWVDLLGAHRTTMTFSRAARTTAELGEMLRRELHAGLC